MAATGRADRSLAAVMHLELPGGETEQNVRQFCRNLGNGAQISSSRFSREAPITAAIYNSNLVKPPFGRAPVRGFDSINK